MRTCPRLYDPAPRFLALAFDAYYLLATGRGRWGMAGKVQHEIPRLYQRGFLIPDTGNAERIWVFRADKVFPSNIDRSGAESYFYSELPKVGEHTLDDAITEYERARLTALVSLLRAQKPGDIVDGETAAEVIAHLTTRNAHIRGTFKSGLETMVAGAEEVFTDEDKVRRMAGIDGPMIPDRFRELIANVIDKLPIPNREQIPTQLLEMLIFAVVREGFSSMFENQIPQLRAQLAMMATNAPDMIRDSHNKALAESLVPDKRAQDLSGFAWHVEESPVDLILPDCVALAFGDDGAEPLMMAGSGKRDMIVLPLTARTALVGGRQGLAEADLSTFNATAAVCSHAYFLASARTPELQALTAQIGTFGAQMMKSVVQSSFEKLLRTDELSAAEPTPALAAPLGGPITLTIQGEFEADAPPKITDAVKEVLAQAAWTMGFDRLDGITIADDYPGAVAEIDRGMPGVRNATARDDEFGTGIAQAVTVLRDGVMKNHVVVQSVVAHNLLSENEPDRAWAGHILASQIAHADITQLFDETLPGVMLSSTCQGLDAHHQRATYPAWLSYFAARATADFDPNHLGVVQGHLLHAMEIAHRVIPKERFDYRTHGDLERLIEATFPLVMTVLEQAASLLGHADGAGIDPLHGSPELEADLKAKELLAWLSDFRRDLAWLWDRRGRWQSYDEFLALGRHMDRLLWPHHIIPWTTDENWGVEIPGAIDEVAWLALQSDNPPKAEDTSKGD